MTERFRRYTLLVALLVSSAVFAGWAAAQDKKPEPATEPITKGQRVFTCAHSFHYFMPLILPDMARGAGIKDHETAGLSSIGGSRVIQHWDVPEDKNKAKQLLK